jgi:hypothetical protein
MTLLIIACVQFSELRKVVRRRATGFKKGVIVPKTADPEVS